MTQLALVAMAENITGKHGETLYRALTKPEQLRSGSGGVTAATLQGSSISAIDSQSLPALRTRLAQQIGAVAEPFKKPLTEMLLKQRPDNIRAQVELYAANAVEQAAKKTLQGSFATYGRQALNNLMSVTEQEERRAGFGGGPGGAGFGPAGGGPGSAERGPADQPDQARPLGQADRPDQARVGLQVPQAAQALAVHRARPAAQLAPAPSAASKPPRPRR